MISLQFGSYYKAKFLFCKEVKQAIIKLADIIRWCFLQDKYPKGETLKKKIAADSDDEESSSDSSDDESPRAISYRTPFFTQVCLEIFRINQMHAYETLLQI